MASASNSRDLQCESQVLFLSDGADFVVQSGLLKEEEELDEQSVY